MQDLREAMNWVSGTHFDWPFQSGLQLRLLEPQWLFGNRGFRQDTDEWVSDANHMQGEHAQHTGKHQIVNCRNDGDAQGNSLTTEQANTSLCSKSCICNFK